MRGTPRSRRLKGCWTRTIPAYAGNTLGFRSGVFRLRDHPRVCGEHSPRAAQSAIDLGSSPRMRGTLCLCLINVELLGIIPAYAGNTIRIVPRNAAKRDHPRVCGEHSQVIDRQCLPPGSSPRMRGTLPSKRESMCSLGIIPAYAGNTGEHQKRRCFRWDHPRVCGEHDHAI